MIEKRLRLLGLWGVISLLSYSAFVFISPFFYPGYDWLSSAVSDLCATDAPSLSVANRLNALFGPCGVVSATAVWVASARNRSKLLKSGVSSFLIMEWVCYVGYELFPWVSGESASSFGNIMHLIVTVAVVVLSILSMVLIALSGRKSGIPSISVWALSALLTMTIGAIGSGLMPKAVFGLFERFSTFSTVIFNAILGLYLFSGKLTPPIPKKNNPIT